MLTFNKYDRESEQLALLAEYHAQRERIAAVREVDVLSDAEMEEAYQDLHEWQLDLDFIRHGGHR